MTKLKSFVILRKLVLISVIVNDILSSFLMTNLATIRRICKKNAEIRETLSAFLVFISERGKDDELIL